MALLATAYDPTQVEPRWYQAWLEGGAFRAREDGEGTHVIVIPPPNVTGMLTMGHILNNTIQDVLTRRARLEGKAALWIPGTDHAGIATQTRVEAELRKSEGKTRRDLGRTAFVERVWQWREQYGGLILKQLRKLGASCDWDRTAFTLDAAYSRAVLAAFVECFRRGYIYRGKRMIHWCPASQTALSDEEVIMTPMRGKLYRMRYEVVERPGTWIEISTTRPETLMGDTAVAVHPDDPRYAGLIGLHVWRPFPRAEIPIIGDRAVDLNFGTGALKVTPAHDRVDYEIGQRHGLPAIDVLHPDGTMNALAGPDFAGMDRFAARTAAARKLREMGQLVAEEDYENNVGVSERAGVPIEPRLSDQWWMRYPKVEEAKFAVREGLVRFHPPHWEKTYLHWLENIQDWCLSRQLWWGHRIPVWYRKGADRSDPASWHVSVDGPADPENWEQEDDVLDTWASSWLWACSTLGWPDAAAMGRDGFARFYPTSTLVTGPDIIFLWVARMIIAGLELVGEERPDLSAAAIAALDPAGKEALKAALAPKVPFRDVFFTGIIRDKLGRKMSKSLGNSPDPLDLIERYGTDALRYGIMAIAPTGQDLRYAFEPARGEQPIEAPSAELGRNFCNKLWNVCRFRQMGQPEGTSGEEGNRSLAAVLARLEPAKADEYDHWILARLLETTGAIERAFAEFDLSAYPTLLYAFLWGDFCDWHIEVSKARLQDPATRPHALAVLDLCLRQGLQLLHPLCPHLTEELWSQLGFGGGTRFLQETRLPTAAALGAALAGAGLAPQPTAAATVAQLNEFVTAARALKTQYNLAARRNVTFLLANPQEPAVLARHHETLKRLVGAEEFRLVPELPGAAPATVTPLGTLALDLASAVDVAAERARLGKEIERIEGVLRGINAKLDNAGFVAKAPPAVIDGARKQKAENEARRDELRRLVAGFGG